MLAMLNMAEHYTMKELVRHKDLAGYLNDVQEELMDAILYIQAAREELSQKMIKKHIAELTLASF